MYCWPLAKSSSPSTPKYGSNCPQRFQALSVFSIALSCRKSGGSRNGETRGSYVGYTPRSLSEAAGGASAAAVFVVQPDDVVLAEVRAALHLDQVQRDLAGVGKAVCSSGRNE